ncbi:MAG: NUDIX domain-containing protein [Bacilli bacterium]|nr:NUDIX domain-containing protein [Bacilli bacterium]
MDLIEEIKKFEPFDEDEMHEKEYMLKFIETHDDYLTRDNIFGHLSASAFVVNETHDKFLAVYHIINNGWIYLGGHADGNSDLLSVAKREVFEESGVHAKVLSDGIFSIQNDVVKSHIKNGKHVHFHTHFDVMYLMEAKESEILTYAKDESKGVKWIAFEDAASEEILPLARPIHLKCIEKLKMFDESVVK